MKHQAIFSLKGKYTKKKKIKLSSAAIFAWLFKVNSKKDLSEHL